MAALGPSDVLASYADPHDPFLAEPESPASNMHEPPKRVSLEESDAESESSLAGRNGVRARRARHQLSSLLMSYTGTRSTRSEWTPPADLYAPLMHDTHAPLASQELEELDLNSTRASLAYPVRALPVDDEGRTVPMHKWHDLPSLVLFLATLVATLLLDTLAIVYAPPLGAEPALRPSPYYALSRSVPMLVLVILGSLAAAALFVHTLQRALAWGAARLVHAGMLLTPGLLGLAWAWAFAGSFLYDEEGRYGGGWSTTGLRLLSLLPLVCALRLGVHVYRNEIDAHAARLERGLQFVLDTQRALLVPLAGAMFSTLCIAALFLTLLAQLFLVGQLHTRPAGLVWSTSTEACILLGLTVGTWLWATSIAHGVLTVTVAGAVRDWHQATLDIDAPVPAALPTLHEPAHRAAVRASLPLLGSVCAVTLWTSAARFFAAVLSAVRAVYGAYRWAFGVRDASLPAPLAHLATVGADSLLARADAWGAQVLVLVGVTESDAWSAARTSYLRQATAGGTFRY